MHVMNVEIVRAMIESSLSAGHFFVAEPGRLRLEHVSAEEVPWEVFHGHLLEPARTAVRRRFESWHVFVDGQKAPADTPLISTRPSASARALP